MFIRNIVVLAFTVLASVFASVGSAAVITFATPVNNTGDSSVYHVGTFVYADQTNQSASNQTIGDATFVHEGTYAPISGMSGQYRAIDVNGNITIQAATQSINSGASVGSAAFKAILNQDVFDAAAGGPFPITLHHLTVGKPYTVQIFVADTALTNGQQATVNTALNGGGNTVTVNGYQNGQNVIGTFIADAADENFTYGHGSTFPYINAIQVRLVPEPTSLGLLGLGTLALTKRRRKS